MIDDRVKRRIEKLLRLSDSDNEYEAKTAMRQAMQLMQKHQVNEEDLYQTPIVEKKITSKFKVWPTYLSSLICCLAQVMGCFAVYRNARGWVSVNADATIIGIESDVINVEYLYEVAARMIQSKAERRKKESISDGWPLTRKELNDYKSGLVIGLCEKVESANQEIINEGKGLVPIDTRFDAAKEHYTSKNKITKHKKCRAYDDTEFLAGYEDGKEMSINQGIKGNYNSQLAIGQES